MSQELLAGIDRAYREHTGSIVFALTGRTGSGCSTATATLCSSFDEIRLSNDYESPERRKMSIATDFARLHWLPFVPVTVSSVIFSFLFDESRTQVETLLAELAVPSDASNALMRCIDELQSHEAHGAFQEAMRQHSDETGSIRALDYFVNVLSPKARGLREALGIHYLPLFQRFGDNIRYSGSPCNDTIIPENLFALMSRVRLLVVAARERELSRSGLGARVVIDAVRNPLEIMFLRDHFPGLFAAAITVDDESRHMRLLDLALSKPDIERIDSKEYPETKHLTDYASFVSQNLRDCIQKADIFVANPGKPTEKMTAVTSMNNQLVRYVALALRPGLVTPTRDERCMQIAFVSKLNSGCISRQVGAVVADENHSIHSIGWNDVPRGQTPCLLRDVESLLTGGDDGAFSEFELSDIPLREHLGSVFEGRNRVKNEHGLSCPFCFKDAYNTIKNDKNQVHTRSLHAEENAFLQLAKRGSPGIAGGVLYTTASPCELCSKKAYQLGIKKIVYVDPYPGISGPQILASGSLGTRPELRLFSGAVGHAYHRLYDTLLSIKDEFRVRVRGGTGPIELVWAKPLS